MTSSNVQVTLTGWGHRLAEEAARAGMSPEAFALDALLGATKVSPASPSRVVIQQGTAQHPGKETLVISGGIASSLRGAAQAKGTFSSILARRILVEAIEAPYQQSVFDLA